MSHDWSSGSPSLPHRITSSRHSFLANQSSSIPEGLYSNDVARHIKPLPKRKIADRHGLSAEQTDQILSQIRVPDRKEASPTFSFAFSSQEKQRTRNETDNTEGATSMIHDHDGTREDGILLTSKRFNPDMSKTSPNSGSLHLTSNTGGISNSQIVSNANNVNYIHWATSSGDGEEAFENINNKKKRKSSVTGTMSIHGPANEFSKMSLKENDSISGVETGSSPAIYNASGRPTAHLPTESISLSSSKNRLGRNGRGSMDRRPLTTSTNAVNLSGSARSRLSPATNKSSLQSPGDGSPGIISSAIANAQQHQKLPTRNGLTYMATVRKPQPFDQGQVSFSFGSSAPPPGPPLFVGQSNNMQAPHRGADYQARPSSNGSTRALATPTSTNSTSQTPRLNDPSQPVVHPKKQKPRKPGRIYETAARQRKLQQENANFLHPPKRQDMWICEFCDYEAVYGKPPRALIRVYEVKDRKEQLRQAERRRLLEKAKIKGRKGKKAAAAAAAAKQAQAHKQFAHHAAEFQKNEMLRATAKLESHKQQLQQAHRELQAHNAAALQQQQQEQRQHRQQSLSYDDLEDEQVVEDEDLEYDDDDIYDDEEVDYEEGIDNLGNLESSFLLDQHSNISIRSPISLAKSTKIG